MEQSELMPRTFADYRATRFRDAPVHVAVCEYLEQLASQTGTSIDHWSLDSYMGIAPHDRRAVNRAFFARLGEGQPDETKLDEHSETLLEAANSQFEGAKAERLSDLQSNYESKLRLAVRACTEHTARVKEAWDIKKEVYALEQRPANYVTEEVRRLLRDGFWSWHKYENGALFLHTKNAVMMTETNAAAGIDTRVVMGRYIGKLQIARGTLRVHRYRQNIVTKDGYYHPYVYRDGDICWGNAGSQATNLLAKGQIYEVFSLLASLLITYTPEATPYEPLYAFDAAQEKRRDGDETSEVIEDDDEDDEPRCDNCDAHTDDCECYYCEYCDERTSDRCETHFCSVCEEYRRRPEDCCCTRCEQSTDNCDCCHDCGKLNDDCTRCRDCDSHDGHESTCDHAEPETPMEF